ncbi:MAG: hypothetical protein DHS20C16_15530 [Phycisphaerae bacterium]|nr:MAG: hypothetical protein DHS20C16_15530 [Phycisphaerae bacterium]
MIIRNPGSKSRTARKLLQLAPSDGIAEYREPFTASGAVFYKIPHGRYPHRWLNDINPFFYMAHKLHRDDHDRQFRDALLRIRERTTDNPELTQRYFRFLADRLKQFEYPKHVPQYVWLTRHAYGQMVSATRKNGASIDPRYNGNVGNSKDGMRPLADPRLDWCYDYLQGTKITNLDFEQVINAPADHGDVLLYLDPPYYIPSATVHHGAPIYAHPFAFADHDRLHDALRATQHRWMLSYNVCKYTIRTYVIGMRDYQSPHMRRKGVNVAVVPMIYTGKTYNNGIGKTHKGKRKAQRLEELLVWNFD